jgi:hypothetical protein
MLGLILSVQAMTYNSLEQIIDDAAQGALNEHPSNNNIDELVVFASNFIRMQLGVPY